MPKGMQTETDKGVEELRLKRSVERAFNTYMKFRFNETEHRVDEGPHHDLHEYIFFLDGVKVAKISGNRSLQYIDDEVEFVYPLTKSQKRSIKKKYF